MQKAKLPLPTSEVICSDNLAYLKTIPDNFFDSVVTDPPYGLGDEPDAMEVLKDWIEKGYHEVKAKGGFMGKSWDNFVPQPNFWKEVFRVLKPGGHLLAFGGTRTYDWMVMSLRLGGFEIRDQLMWMYGSGFPKSSNISKNIDKAAGAEREIIGKRSGTFADIKRDKETGQDGLHGGIAINRERIESFITVPATDEAKQWDGWGTALKPAYEPICLARKPISEKTIVKNVLKHRTGAINIDDCRIGFKNGEHNLSIDRYKYTPQTGNNGWEHINRGANFNELSATKGRWPANIILSHHPDCEYIGSKKVKGSNCKPEDIGSGNKLHTSNGIYSEIKSQIRSSHVDSDGQETVDHYNCHPDCPIKIMDEQSGMLKSGAVTKHYEYKSPTTSMEGSIGGINTTLREESIGGASRFFYCAKASRSERNKGLENYGQNTHPTVKPVKIMQYLVRLITPPGGTCLDPYNGSGTTGIACKLEGFNYVGIDDKQEHVDISIGRIKSWEPEPEDYDNQLSLF